LPVISLAVDADKLFDYYDGIYTAGIDFDNWRNRNPQEDYLWPYQGNFIRKGEEIISGFEFFSDINHSATNQLVGIKINGGTSRSMPMKSLLIVPNLSYGNEYINCKLFSGSEDSVFNDIALRNSGNDFPSTIWEPNYFQRTMLRDAYVHTICKHNHFDTQDYQPIILFLNGEFWGIHNIREKYNYGFFNRKYGFKQYQYNLLAGNANVVNGQNSSYLDFIDFLTSTDLANIGFRENVERYIDLQSFIDYYISNIFIHNTDWPSLNIYFWSINSGVDIDNYTNLNGKWRWMMSDTDMSFGLFNMSGKRYSNDLEYYYDDDSDLYCNQPWSTFVFRTLMENEVIREEFLAKFEWHLLNTFNPQITVELIDSLAKEIESAIPFHLQRWSNDFYSFSDWKESINQMRVFAIERPCEIREMLKEYFDIQNPMYAFGVCDSDFFSSDNFCENVFVFPNPATDIITIKISQGKHYSCKIDLYNSFGEVLMFKDCHVFDTELSFNISALPQAVYYIRIECGDFYCVKKIVKI
jgi:hypothetical protein